MYLIEHKEESMINACTLANRNQDSLKDDSVIYFYKRMRHIVETIYPVSWKQKYFRRQ